MISVVLEILDPSTGKHHATRVQIDSDMPTGARSLLMIVAHGLAHHASRMPRDYHPETSTVAYDPQQMPRLHTSAHLP